MRLSSLSVGKRLAFGFFVVVVTMVIVTVSGVTRVENINDRMTVINDVNSVKQRYAINFRGSVHDRAISLRDVVLAPDTDTAESDIADIDRLEQAYDESAVELDRIFESPDLVNDVERAAYAEIQRVQAATLPVVAEVIELRMNGNVAEATALLSSEARPLFTDWLRSINVLIDLEESMNQTEATAVRDVSQGFLVLMLVMCGAAVVIAVVVAWRIARSITGPMSDAVSVFAAVADGDLTQRLSVESKDGLGEMGHHANAALSRISDAMTAVVHSADEVERASTSIDSLSNRIAADAEESASQARNVTSAAQEVSRFVEAAAEGSGQMGASIREIAHSVDEAATVAAEAVDAAVSTNATISQLGDSSREIGDVVRVIATIAEQTNLLALNASIEAARAGEVGKGFAVVASEVKELAQETARATADIAARVEAIQTDTNGAVHAIEDVSAIIQRINDFQTAIAAAVQQQSTTSIEISRGVADAAAGSAQIAENISGVANAAHSTTQSIAESLRAAADLAEVSSRLQLITSQFRL